MHFRNFILVYYFVISTCYPYNLTVYFNEVTDFRLYNAKLKVRFFGKNVSEPIILSKDYEDFHTGDLKNYIIASLYRIQQIDGLSLKWSSKQTWSLSRLIWYNRLYVNDVLLIPKYKTRLSRRLSKKRFCSFNRTVTMKPKEEYYFPIKCN